MLVCFCFYYYFFCFSKLTSFRLILISVSIFSFKKKACFLTWLQVFFFSKFPLCLIVLNKQQMYYLIGKTNYRILILNANNVIYSKTNEAHLFIIFFSVYYLEVTFYFFPLRWYIVQQNCHSITYICRHDGEISHVRR